MRVQSFTRYVGFAVLVGALACARNPEPDTDEAAAARDTTSDTLGGEAQTPPGYRGMERDTAIAPPAEQTPTDTFLQEQGMGTPTDTAGYAGMERLDTTGQGERERQMDPTGAGVQDTSGAWGADTTQADPSGLDTTGARQGGDTTGYNPSQQPSQDTTSYR